MLYLTYIYNKDGDVMETKRKSRFPIVLLILVIVLGIAFAFAANSLKDRYRVLDNSSKEVSSMLSEIKDFRKLKGYKVIKDANDYKIILISAGLTYGKDDSLVVQSIDFESNKFKIVVEESIDPNPEREVITYPYVMVKVDTIKDSFEIVNTNGEVYEEIELHDPTAGIPENPTEKVEEVEEEEDAKEETEVAKEVEEEEDASDNKEEEKVNEVENQNMKYIECEYQGRIDGSSIEVKQGDDYMTFDISSMASTFTNYDYGTKLKIGYVEKNGVNLLVSVTKNS